VLRHWHHWLRDGGSVSTGDAFRMIAVTHWLIYHLLKVVGIELCKAAAEDATLNANLNGIKNAHFIHSKAEDVMSALLTMKKGADEKQSSSAASSNGKKRKSDEQLASIQKLSVLPELPMDDVVAIVDPPRAGLHTSVIK
jgi:tRNA/tmRNA/rRNA uracil-C5-methylase (TrmA/RlmC/RlmD family)